MTGKQWILVIVFIILGSILSTTLSIVGRNIFHNEEKVIHIVYTHNKKMALIGSRCTAEEFSRSLAEKDGNISLGTINMCIDKAIENEGE